MFAIILTKYVVSSAAELSYEGKGLTIHIFIESFHSIVSMYSKLTAADFVNAGNSYSDFFCSLLSHFALCIVYYYIGQAVDRVVDV